MARKKEFARETSQSIHFLFATKSYRDNNRTYPSKNEFQPSARRRRCRFGPSRANDHHLLTGQVQSKPLGPRL